MPYSLLISLTDLPCSLSSNICRLNSFVYCFRFITIFPVPIYNLLYFYPNSLSQILYQIHFFFFQTRMEWFYTCIVVRTSFSAISTKIRIHIAKLYATCKTAPYFERTDASLVLGLKPAMTSLLLKTILTAQLLEPIYRKGKGKYRFVQF